MIAGIVLAAGRSERMLRPKALLPFKGSTVIARVVDALLGGGVNHAIVVVPLGDREIRSALGDRPVVLVENPDLRADMLSSLRCGLCILPADTRGIVVSPVDQPSLGPELVRSMLEAYRNSRRPILVPVYQGKRGHPLIIGTEFVAELLASFDGLGLRGLLQAHPGGVGEWQSEDPAILEDVDTPQDYKAALTGVSPKKNS